MNRQHMGVIVGGILFLVVAMGISRFALTPLLPFMRIDENLSFAQGGWLASSNYVGYFIGALGAAFIYRAKKNFLLLNVVINVTSIILMGFIDSYIIWIVLRLIMGLTSGFIFVLTSSIVMDYLATHLLTRWSGYVFSGIGFGIALSGLLVPFFEARVQWQGSWIGLGMISAIFLVTTVFLWRRLTVPNQASLPKGEQTSIWYGFMPWLIIAYGLEGLGYIITGTFLVDIIYNIEALRSFAGYSWVVVGIAAIPSAPVWMHLMSRFSTISMMALAYAMQIIGILLPVLSQTAWSVLLSAFLYGFTFVGLVTMSTGYARQLYPQQSGYVVSMLTTFYALGQIVGPVIAGRLETYYVTFKAPLLFAGGTVTVALIILIIGYYYSKKKSVPIAQELYN
ncbi:YbfB/YjiJ family MFS transporter [Solibacillus daqui]|uniref:YbfB/YjiJ family MFS transporter n=1 Tax=Solibacillus daqui TaxID=2912187 RepID=UPI002366ECEE|nr:YbfB/YjiJ family MFS transporter [Solibacillus daqui]